MTLIQEIFSFPLDEFAPGEVTHLSISEEFELIVLGLSNGVIYTVSKTNDHQSFLLEADAAIRRTLVYKDLLVVGDAKGRVGTFKISTGEKVAVATHHTRSITGIAWFTRHFAVTSSLDISRSSVSPVFTFGPYSGQSSEGHGGIRIAVMDLVTGVVKWTLDDDDEKNDSGSSGNKSNSTSREGALSPFVAINDPGSAVTVGPPAHPEGVSCLCLQGDILVSGGSDGGVAAWQVSRRKRMWLSRSGTRMRPGFGSGDGHFEGQGHDGEIVGMLLSAWMVLSAGVDGKLKRWNLTDGSCTYTVDARDPICSMSWLTLSSSSSKILLSTSSGPRSKIHIVNPSLLPPSSASSQTMSTRIAYSSTTAYHARTKHVFLAGKVLDQQRSSLRPLPSPPPPSSSPPPSSTLSSPFLSMSLSSPPTNMSGLELRYRMLTALPCSLKVWNHEDDSLIELGTEQNWQLVYGLAVTDDVLIAAVRIEGKVVVQFWGIGEGEDFEEPSDAEMDVEEGEVEAQKEGEDNQSQ